MFSDILDHEQLKILEKMRLLKPREFYLAGGTALALQLGHRTSVDFDFYSLKKFNSRLLISKLYKVFGSRKIKEYFVGEDTLRVEIENVEVSFFYYDYHLIRKPQEYLGIPLASIEDIAAMKVIAIIQRGTKRDFIDVYYLIQKYSLTQILFWAEEKYPSFNQILALKGLLYFEDAEKSTNLRPMQIFDKTLTWTKVKKYITQQVIAYQKNFFYK